MAFSATVGHNPIVVDPTGYTPPFVDLGLFGFSGIDPGDVAGGAISADQIPKAPTSYTVLQSGFVVAPIMGIFLTISGDITEDIQITLPSTFKDESGNPINTTDCTVFLWNAATQQYVQLTYNAAGGYYYIADFAGGEIRISEENLANFVAGGEIRILAARLTSSASGGGGGGCSLGFAPLALLLLAPLAFLRKK